MESANPRPIPQATGRPTARLRVRSYNLGGVSGPVYDHLHFWLTTACKEDVVILQELHWGCGRTEATWTIPGWSMVVSADPQQRYAGVGILISNRVAAPDDISYTSSLPGRLLHVRCTTTGKTLDVIAGYQWVRTEGGTAASTEKRSKFWMSLGALLHSIPTRCQAQSSAGEHSLARWLVVRCIQAMKQAQAARQQWFEEHIQTAEVRIRSATGSMLGPREEFQDILRHFRAAFDGPEPTCPMTDAPVAFAATELSTAIVGLKNGKAVPPTSVPAEIWKMCPSEYADRLARILNETCAQSSPLPPEAITLFADDSHFTWEISSIADLKFLVRCVRATFRTFREFGMQLNMDKSRIVVRLQGGTAKRWLKTRTPHACVRSSLLYGLHAVGITPQALTESQGVVDGPPGWRWIDLRRRWRRPDPWQPGKSFGWCWAGKAKHRTSDPSMRDVEENKETAEDERRPKWAKPASKGGKGAGNKATQDLMSQMVRAMLRHEAEIQRLKQDLGYMVFIDTSGLGCLPVLRRVAENWQDQYTKGTVTSPLRLVMFLAMLETLKTTAEETLADEEKLQRCMNVGWTVAGENALSPKWVYHSWDPAAKKQIVATDPPISHAEALRLVDQLMKHAPQEGVLKNFKTTRRLTAQDQYKAEVLPFIVSIGLRGESSAICFNALLLSGSAIMKLIGVRIRPERGQEPQLIKQLKQSYMGTTFCEWTKKQTQWGGDA
ncbi:unnamed protein product [Symbiodinium microadriaticum]|nr:unnamed protein product [Symbiodinium microadriaticum]